MISVIVPVFNGERYLSACIESVLAQSYTDIELIIVDDGSTDSSGTIADRYARDYSGIRVIHCENGGMSYARNVGIEASAGEYVYFLDSDDMMHPEALGRLRRKVEDMNVDLVIGGAEIGETYTIKRIHDVVFSLMLPEEVIKNSLYQNGILHAPWGKLYKKSLLDQVRFTKGLCYEDLDFFYRYCLLCDRIAVTHEKLYFYRQHPASIMHTWTPQRLDVLNVVDEIERYMSENNPGLLPAARDRKLSANFNIFILAHLHGQPDVADKCWKVIKNYRTGSLIDSNVRLKNKAGILLSYLGPKAFAFISSFLF